MMLDNPWDCPMSLFPEKMRHLMRLFWFYGEDLDEMACFVERAAIELTRLRKIEIAARAYHIRHFEDDPGGCTSRLRSQDEKSLSEALGR